jgi:hypothetical protein
MPATTSSPARPAWQKEAESEPEKESEFGPEFALAPPSSYCRRHAPWRPCPQFCADERRSVTKVSTDG